MCETNELTRSGDDPEGIFPAILGHEGARIVVEVGDHVIPLYSPECLECEYCLNPKQTCVRLSDLRKDASFDKICYIGCGVTIGIGAVINTAKVEIGNRAIVFGFGGIGLNVVQGLCLSGADQIVGVDLNGSKAEMCTQFGMTDFANPSNIGGDLVTHLV